MAELGTNIQSEELQIDLFDILRDLLKDWWMILLMGLACAMCTYIISDMTYKPAYSCNATFAVTSRGANSTYDNLTAASMVATSLANIFSSDIIKKKVADDIGAQELPDYITATPIPETNLFVLTVSAPSPAISYRIIKSVMNNYLTVTSNVYQEAILDVLEEPTIPSYPDNPKNNGKRMRLALLIGMGTMAALLIVLSVMRDTIKNERDIANKLDIKLFGVIYHERKNKTLRSALLQKKKSILITSPTVSFTFMEAIKKIRARYEYKSASEGCRVLLITSTLENEGKSTIAVNLALALAQKSNKVLLIDADFRKPSIYKLLQQDTKPEQEFGEYLMGNREIQDIFRIDKNTDLFLLLGGNSYKNSSDLIAREEFADLIEVQKKVMDYIIIDSPPVSIAVDAELLADIADTTLLVVRQSYTKAKLINDAIDTLSGTKSELLGCIYNNVYHMPRQSYGYGHYKSYKKYDYYKESIN